MRNSILKLAAAVAVAGMCAAPAGAADKFPNKPINYIIPFNAGGESDISARYQQAAWEKYAGQPVVIQYQAGAGGARAWSTLNTLETDGHTIMGINLPHTVLQPMVKDVGYKTDDLTPVHYFHYTPNAIFVAKDSEFQTLADLVAYAKKNPGTVTFSGSGSNTANHLAAAQFDELAGIKTTYVPFSGTGPAVTAIMGKQTVAGFNYAPSGIKHGDKMRMLAVASEKRMSAFPDVPTFKELGYDLVGGAYRGLAVPKGASETVRKQVSDLIAAINGDADFRSKMEAGGFVLTEVTYDKMPAFVKAKKAEYAKAAGLLGIKSQ